VTSAPSAATGSKDEVPKAKGTTKPRLIFFTSSVSGQCRRAEGFLAQVLQRRQNHGTFRLYAVDRDERPDMFRRFDVDDVPTLVVVEGRQVRGRLAKPRGCRAIEAFLAPWLR
jgi:thioredoxin-like negative regulator of GroEL